MRNVKQIELTLENPDYSWHIAESDGETWVILRDKKKLDACLITEITDICLERFSWEVFLQEKEKRLYKGTLGLRVRCGMSCMSDLSPVVSDAADEEALSRELFLPTKKQSFPQYQRKEEASTLFADLLLDSLEAVMSPDEDNKSGIVIDIPWQAWLYGDGKELDPKLVKVHVAQTGLCSILLEAVIKLEVQKVEPSCEPSEKNISLLLKDEKLLQLKDKEIGEVVGIADRTAFHASYRYHGLDNVILETMKKMSVIFVSPLIAQERIMVASATAREHKEITARQLPSVQPVYFKILRKSRKIERSDSSKVFYRDELFYTLDYETTQEVSADEACFEKEDIPVSAAVIPIPLERQRPGEKYLKKSKQTKAIKNKSSSTIVISLRK